MAAEIQDGKRIRESYKIDAFRKSIAEKMIKSASQYPTVRGSAYFETDRVLALKDRLKEQNPNITMTALFTKLTAEALKLHPMINSALIDNEEFIIYDSINIGVGVGLPQGVIPVVIKEAQDKNIFQIADELSDHIAKLKVKKLGFEHMMGSTFTISNMGIVSVEQVESFLNPPETGILSIGATRKQIIVNDDDTTRIGHLTCFTSAINHAAVDGLQGGQFFQTLKNMVEAPESHLGL